MIRDLTEAVGETTLRLISGRDITRILIQLGTSKAKLGRFCPGDGAVVALAFAISLILAMWDFNDLHGYGFKELTNQPFYFLFHIVLDALLSLPFVGLGLVGLWVLAEKEKGGVGDLLGTAVCISYVLVFLMTPINAARVAAHPAFDDRIERLESALVYEPSFGHGVRASVVSDPAVDTGERGVIVQLAWHGLTHSLKTQWIVLPVLVLGMLCMAPWRQLLLTHREDEKTAGSSV